MSAAPDRRRVTVVSACMTRQGTPDFALHEVEVTADEYLNGVQYDRAEERLAAGGYEEPYVHFEEAESPQFLVPAVRQYLGLREGGPDPTNLIALEGP
jgi:hypothetical protein